MIMANKITSVPVDLEADRATAEDSLLTSTKFATTSTGSMELVGLPEKKPIKLLEFEAQYRQPHEKRTAVELAKEAARKRCSKLSMKKVVMSNLPILRALKNYQVLRDLPSDLVAGITSGVMMIPQGMAFASLSTLDPIIGLYISLFSSLTYFFLGTGQQSSFGCIAILSIMMGSILDKYEHRLQSGTDCTTPLTSPWSHHVVNDTTTLTSVIDYSGTTLNMSGTTLADDLTSDLYTKKLQLAGGVSLLCGVIFILLGKLGFGKVTIFMSDSLVTGFTVGAAFHIGSSQLKTMFGLSFLTRYSGLFKLLKLWYAILSNIHRSNPASIIASFICILIIYLVKRFVNEKYKKRLKVPIPIELFVMILATVVSYYGDLYTKFKISIIKDVPTGVPKPHLPNVIDGFYYLSDGLVIIVVAFIQTVSVAKLMGLKHKYKVDSDQEMFAVGMVNVVCAMFSGYISGASISRSVVQDGAGGKSQIASLFAAVLVLLVMLFMGPYFYHVPKCALSAIIIVSLRSLMLKLLTIPDMWRKSEVDCVIFVTTVVAVVVLDADVGLFVGVMVSVLLVLFQSMRSAVDVTTLIPVGQQGIWKSKDKYLSGEQETDLCVVRVNSPLFFINAEIVTNAVFKKTGLNPLRMKKDKTVEVHAQNEKANGAYNNTRKPSPDTLHVRTVSSDVENGKDGITKSEPISSQSSHSSSKAVSFSTLILDLSGVSFIDLMGVKALEFLIEEYTGVGVSVFITNVTDRCLHTLTRSGFMGKHGDVVLLTVETALMQQSENHSKECASTQL